MAQCSTNEWADEYGETVTLLSANATSPDTIMVLLCSCCCSDSGTLGVSLERQTGQFMWESNQTSIQSWWKTW